MPWKTNHEPSILDKLSPHEQEFFSKLSPKGKEAAEKLLIADKKTQAMAAFPLVLHCCWHGKDTKISKEQFFDIVDALFNFLWLAASMETARLASEDGSESVMERLALLQIYGSQEASANAKQL